MYLSVAPPPEKRAGIFLAMIPISSKESGIIPLKGNKSREIKGSKANFKESSLSHQNEQ